jgi:hypothetical protein
MFDSRPSVPALALRQALLSTLLYWLTPIALNRQFRVGPDIGLGDGRVQSLRADPTSSLPPYSTVDPRSALHVAIANPR